VKCKKIPSCKGFLAGGARKIQPTECKICEASVAASKLLHSVTLSHFQHAISLFHFVFQAEGEEMDVKLNVHTLDDG